MAEYDELSPLYLHLEKSYQKFAKEVDAYRALFQTPNASAVDIEEEFVRVATMLRGESGRGINYDALCAAEYFGLSLAEMSDAYWYEGIDTYNEGLADEVSGELSAFTANVVQKAIAAGLYYEDPTYENDTFAVYDDFFDGGGPGPTIWFGKEIKTAKLPYLSSTGLVSDRIKELSPSLSLEINEHMFDATFAELQEKHCLQIQKFAEEEELRMLEDIEPDENDYDVLENLDFLNEEDEDDISDDYRSELVAAIRGFSVAEEAEDETHFAFGDE